VSEEDIEDIKMKLDDLKVDIQKILNVVVPEKKDYSTQSATAQELVKKGKLPRKQPKKKDEGIIQIRCRNCEELRSINKSLWNEGKTFECKKCGKDRFNKVGS